MSSMNNLQASRHQPHHRHIHLGKRLEVAESIRRHQSTPEEAAAALGVPVDEVMDWVASDERAVSIDEVLVSPDAQRLTRRAQRLVALIAQADAAIRELTDRLAHATRAAHHGAE
jgi:hypothetical protein